MWTKDAMDWMDANQLGRRNLTPDAFRLLLGRRYNRAKGQGKRTDLTSPQNEEKLPAAKLATEHGVSKATVERAGQYVEAVDKLGLSEEANAGELSGATQKVVVDAARDYESAETPEAKAAIIERVKAPHVSHNSGKNEWYTPSEYLEAAPETGQAFGDRAKEALSKAVFGK